VPFELPEYHEAFTAFAYSSVNALARAQSPLLGGIKEEVVESGGSTVVDSRTDERLDLSSEPVGFELEWERDDVLNGNFEALLLQLDSASLELAEKLVGMFVKTMGEVTEATGNVVNAEGSPPTFELIYDMLDKIVYSLDDDDELQMPSMIMHPDMVKKLPTLTPEQEAALDELKQRKREELLAKRRRRRLS
jgi:hypothetical protein